MNANDVLDRLNAIYTDLEENIVKIPGRKDLMFLVDLSYHSVLKFKFQGTLLEKGVVEILVVGDTRTGKTHVVKHLNRHYGLGDFILGESVTFAGLLGGVDEGGGRNKTRFIKTGRLPLSHRGLVAIDEANEIPLEIMSKLSGVRSSGVIDIIKIVQQTMPCRVRLIWIANPRSEKSIGQYPYGVAVVPEVVGKREDIARFDAAIIVSDRDVDRDALYRIRSEAAIPHRMTRELCKYKVLWCWSRRPNQVILTEGCEEAILAVSKDLAGKYDSSIPLVVETEQRVKIARMSVAVAGILHSTDESRENLIVTPAHVEALGVMLDKIYSSESMGYLDYSRSVQSSQMGDVDRILRALGRRGMAAILGSKSGKVNERFLTMVMHGSSAAAKEIMNILVLSRAAYPALTGGLELSEDFITELRRKQLDSSYPDSPDVNEVVASNNWGQNKFEY